MNSCNDFFQKNAELDMFLILTINITFANGILELRHS